MPTVSEAIPPFVPTWWLPTADLQTIVTSYLPASPAAAADRTFEVALEDGDRLVCQENDPRPGEAGAGEADPADGPGVSVRTDLIDPVERRAFLARFDAEGGAVGDDAAAPGSDPEAPIAVLIHGLGGSHLSPYVVRMTARLVGRGWRVVRADMRGFGQSAWTCRRHTHAGQGEDVAAILDDLTGRYPGAPLAVVGYSLGGNMVLRYLAEAGAAHPSRLITGVAVCPPIDLTACAANIRRFRNRLYDASFTNNLWRMVRARRKAVADLHDREMTRRPRALAEFDDWYTAPLHGFRDAADYYDQASSGPHLGRIAAPTLIVASADDPIIPFPMFDRWPVPESVTLVTTEKGGHVGWLGRPGDDPDGWWMDWRVVGWLTSRREAFTAPRPLCRSASPGIAGFSALAGH